MGTPVTPRRALPALRPEQPLARHFLPHHAPLPPRRKPVILTPLTAEKQKEPGWGNWRSF